MWPRLVNAAVGVWLMAAPAVLAYGPPAATSDRIVGPLIATFALIAIWDVLRPLRHVALALGVWLLAAPLLLGYDSAVAIVNDLACGVIVILAARVRGRTGTRFAGGWREVVSPAREDAPPPPHRPAA